MKHFITVTGIVIILLTWLTPFVERVLAVVWPVAALALLVIIVCGTLSLSVYVLGLSFRTLAPRPTPIELIPPMAGVQEVLHAFARDSTRAEQAMHDPEVHRTRWNTAVMQFCLVGDRVGFSVRSMHPYIKRDRRQVYINLLVPHHILETDNEGTRWGRGWNYYGLRSALKNDVVTLPYPNGEPPTVVLWAPGQHAHPTQHTQHRTPSTPLGVMTIVSETR